MNTCILMAEIIKEPELRYTPDNTPLTEMLVEFSVPGMRDEEKLPTLKVVGWRNLATEIKEQYHQGDRVIIEGRLNMNTIDRPEGFKEKRAELTASRIYKVGDVTNFSTGTNSSGAEDRNNTVMPSFEPSKRSVTTSSEAEVGMGYSNEYDSQPIVPKVEIPTKTPATSTPSGGDLDDIPF